VHVPDGFIAPVVYLPAYGACAALWAYGVRRVRRMLTDEAMPSLAVTTAFAFVLMMVPIPLPGGTSAHPAGIAILAILFGVWFSFVALSLVFLIQALLFGIGGITSLPVSALAMGLCGSAAARAAMRALRPLGETAGLFVAGWLSLVVSSLLIAVILGIEPSIAHREDGTPLFFPFGLSLTLPAVVLPHALLGVGEGILTVLVCRYIGKRRPGGLSPGSRGEEGAK
jgi:cobalt/nickel transport system permease protein